MANDDKKRMLNCIKWRRGPLSGRQNTLWIVPIFALILISGCVGPFSNCITGSGNVVSKDFTVDKFHSVDFGGFGNLYVTQKAQQSMRIEAEDNILELLNVDVANGKLIISSSRCFTNIKPVNVYVSMDEVRNLAGSGSVNIIGQSDINSDALRLSISGSGSIDVTLSSEELNTEITGSGKANLKGTADVHNSIISGSGNIRAFDLSTNRTDMTISGSGNAEVDASRELDVTISGSGNVFYTGNASVTQRVSGSGKIVKR